MISLVIFLPLFILSLNPQYLEQHMTQWEDSVVSSQLNVYIETSDELKLNSAMYVLVNTRLILKVKEKNKVTIYYCTGTTPYGILYYNQDIHSKENNEKLE